MIGESIKITVQKFRLSDKQDLCSPISPLSLNANLRKLLQSRSMRRESIQTGINYNALCNNNNKKKRRQQTPLYWGFGYENPLSLIYDASMLTFAKL